MREWWRDARGEPSPIPWAGTRRAVHALVVIAAITFATLSLLRWHTFHNETFDLAFYARMAWGAVHGDGWNPIVGAHELGLHLAWILRPLGVIGMLFGQAPTLLVAQSIALSAAALPIARIGARHLGAPGAIVAALAWLLHPNLAHVASEEFHPGSVAVLPLAWAADALDRRSGPGIVLATLGVLLCREDLGLVTMLVGVAACGLAVRSPRSAERTRLARAGVLVAVVSLAYVLLFVLVLHPRFAPPEGSLELHFGRFGRSTTEVARYVLTHPGELIEHLSARHRVLYLALITAPCALLPLLRPGFLVIAAPVLAINLLSDFPGTTDLDSHYLTPAMPFVLASAIHGAAALPDGALLRLAPLATSAFFAHVIAGGTPLSLAFSREPFVADESTDAARRIVARIGPSASVQAPDALLPHLAERRDLRRAPPPETRADFVVLDASHRVRFAHDEDLLRTSEEPEIRAWIARDDHALVEAGGDYLLLERGRDPREGIGARAIIGHDDDRRAGRRLTGCLRLRDARLERRGSGLVLTLDLVALGACPSDLALRIGEGKRPSRVDLVANGWLSPAHFRAGDVIRSEHPLGPAEVRPGRLRVGALRSSGARPEHLDPHSLSIDAAFP
ncbi:DUF2079 domain-containing protein [Sandaracinus amylolyticus]|uniref:DUF2079 domain-containing protein n=1 Tax=Sandaracinus amylolyticus TaxID=927083 RepID=A0A0F6WA99_9BACT|nr:DUF2079 domain-containing protein [Sandaracinus amylolyticus]AKF11346.1 hypothetical protein DB32_008495 [Sandaracinus amylolyticus]